ncbi:hypothetical protein [Collimonas silvisoli]|uniref:hypothetical protein n=1 Tax=Collimonas silvisoli TaxID=2825884 RepID=UPI001E4D8172|nr:hypothetical protein [Collimonas silvisoli]
MTVEEVVEQGYGSWVGYKEGPSTPTTGTLFDDKFVLRDGAGKPVPNAIYAVERHSGVFEYGTTNGSGHTHLLSSVAASENINAYLVG